MAMTQKKKNSQWNRSGAWGERIFISFLETKLGHQLHLHFIQNTRQPNEKTFFIHCWRFSHEFEW